MSARCYNLFHVMTVNNSKRFDTGNGALLDQGHTGGVRRIAAMSDPKSRIIVMNYPKCGRAFDRSVSRFLHNDPRGPVHGTAWRHVTVPESVPALRTCLTVTGPVPPTGRHRNGKMEGKVDLFITLSSSVSSFISSNMSTATASMSSIFRNVSSLPAVPDAESLLQMVRTPGPVRDMGLFVAGLPCHTSTRKSPSYVDEQIDIPAPMGKWLPRYRDNLWALYVWVVHVCRPAGPNVHDREAERHTTKKARPALAGAGIVRRKKQPLGEVAAAATHSTIRECRSHMCVLWMDNYNKQRFSKNPGVVPSQANRRSAQAGDTNASINGAVFAILPCEGVPPNANPVLQPSVVGLQQAVPNVVNSLQQARPRLQAAVEVLLGEGHTWATTRVPCDVARYQVSIAPWRPYAVRPESVSTTGGLLQLLDGIHTIRRDTGNVDTLPLLVDVDIFYRIMKLMLSETWVAYPLRQYLQGHPLLFGVWHGYKQCVTRCFKHFLPFWVAVQSPTFLTAPAATKVPRHPPLVTMETLVSAMFVVAPALQRTIQSAIARIAENIRRHPSRPRDGCLRPVDGTEGVPSRPDAREYAVKQLECLRLLVTQYVPALFLMGKWVRDCHWELHTPNTGGRVKLLLQLQTTFLLALRPKRGRHQYLTNTLLALLQWNPVMDTLPGMAWGEETREASIGRLAADVGRDMTAGNVQEVHNLYVTQRSTAGEVRDVTRNPMSRHYPAHVTNRVGALLARIANFTVPFIEWGGTKETYVFGQERWPRDKFVFPPDLWAVHNTDGLTKDCNSAIDNVLTPVREDEKNRDSLAEARAHLDRRFANSKVSSDLQRQRLRAIVDFRHHAGTDVPRPNKRKRRGHTGVPFGPWLPGSRAPPPSGAPPPGLRARRGHRPPPARRPGNPGHVHRRGVLGPLHPRAVPSAGQDVIVLSDDASHAQGLPTGHHQRADIPHSSRQSSVSAESSESTSTLSSSSTSSLSSTTTSSLPSSSSAGDGCWSDVERDMAPVASESDEWDVQPETDAVTGEVDVVARRNPKGGGSQGPA